MSNGPYILRLLDSYSIHLWTEGNQLHVHESTCLLSPHISVSSFKARSAHA